MGVRPFNAHFKLFIINKQKKMSTKIDYFGEFTTTLVLFDSRLKYIEEAGIEIISKEIHNSKVDSDDILYLVTFKVNSMTLLHLYSAGVRDGMNKSYKNKI